MKKVFVLIILICSVISTYSQTDSLFLKNYEQKILENNKLRSELQEEKQNFSALNEAYKKDTLALQKEIRDLSGEVAMEKEKVSELNKNKIKEERDNLLKKVDSLNAVISKQNQLIVDKDKQIINEKANAKTSADSAKNNGKAEAFSSIINFYKNHSFDDLIQSSTLESIGRDLQLVGNNPEVNLILNDLQIYFSALELISQKYDAVNIKSAQTQLNLIKQQSKLLDVLKVNVEYYEDFNTDLKKTIEKIVDLDKIKTAAGSPEIQKLKFNEVLSILTDYMYNYYDYAKYPYLSEIMLEIIKRKQPNADSSIIDLLQRL